MSAHPLFACLNAQLARLGRTIRLSAKLNHTRFDPVNGVRLVGLSFRVMLAVSLKSSANSSDVMDAMPYPVVPFAICGTDSIPVRTVSAPQRRTKVTMRKALSIDTVIIRATMLFTVVNGAAVIVLHDIFQSVMLR